VAENFTDFFPLPKFDWMTPAGRVSIAFAEHHNIMQSLFLTKGGSVQPMFVELAKFGFDVQSFAANGWTRGQLLFLTETPSLSAPRADR
jgi:hypothetical protein